MIEIIGEHGKAKVMTDHIEKTAIAQVKELCDQPWTKNIPIRVMPDCHAGKGCVIGLTMPIKETVVSNLVGVDIGCGMEVIKIANKELKIEDYLEIMEGIYTTSLSRHTLDEAPMAYKDMKVILEHLNETVEVLEIIKPVYNFKAQN